MANRTNKLPRYVWRRAESRFLWFRMAVPKEFQAVAGKRLIQCSLDTSDVREAAVLAGGKRAELIAGWNDGCLMGGQGSEPSQPELDAAAVRYGYKLMRERFASQRGKLAGDEAGWEAYKAERTEKAERRIRQMNTGDLSQLHEPAKQLAAAEGWRLDGKSPLFAAFVERLATATLDAMTIERKQLAGEFSAEPTSPLVRGEIDRAANAAKPGESLLELFDRYAEQRLAEGAKRPDVLRQDRKVVEQFASFVGEKRRVESIGPEDVREFRDLLRKLPTRWRERQELMGLSMKDAAQKAEKLNLPRVQLTTVNKYLSTVSPIFAWLIEEQYNITNPFNGLFHKGVKGRNPRPPFSTEQLNKILRSPLFVGFKADGAESKPGTTQADDWRKWVPLVAMFTGARVGEVAQLRVEDIERHESGVWFMTIRHDEATGQTTKSGQSRPAIVHSKLVSLGFLDFVARQRERAAVDGNPQLFPHLRANERDQIGDMPS